VGRNLRGSGRKGAGEMQENSVGAAGKLLRKITGERTAAAAAAAHIYAEGSNFYGLPRRINVAKIN